MFGRGGTEKAAQRLGLPYLGAIPMFTEVPRHSDAGTPIQNFETNLEIAKAFENVARNLSGEINKRIESGDGPTLTVT
jgi:ATP-binding protein involved in chromosome partitioning